MEQGEEENAAAVNKLQRRIVRLERALKQAREDGNTSGEFKGVRPLERSSLEAYTGIAIAIVLAVLLMTWWLRVVLFIVLAFVVADFGWRSPFSYRWPWWVRVPMIVTFASAIAWVGRQNVQDAYTTERFPPRDVSYMLNRGAYDQHLLIKVAPPPQIIGNPGGLIVIDGTLLKSYGNRYKLISVCFHYDGTGDLKDVINVSKTGPFDIKEGQIETRIPWSSTYVAEMLAGATGTNYVVLMVPRDGSADSFGSIREAESKGAHILQMAGGPP